MPRHIVTLRRWQVGLAFAAVTLAYVGALLWTQHLSNARLADIRAETHQRIEAIQHERLESCRHTYEGVRQIFHPFFRPTAKRTPTERRNIRKFNRTVDRYKARCGKQTGVKGSP